MTQELTQEEAARGLRDGSLTLVDVLPRASFEACHIPGAVHLALEEVEANARRALPDRERPIVVYCAGPD
jgi:rhodanese-related sulfurtransferase